MQYFNLSSQALIYIMPLVILTCLAGCDRGESTAVKTPAGEKIVAMTEVNANFAILKQKADGTLVACFYENWDDHKPLKPQGCALVPSQDVDAPTASVGDAPPSATAPESNSTSKAVDQLPDSAPKPDPLPTDSSNSTH